jgi:hypothetical protein
MTVRQLIELIIGLPAWWLLAIISVPILWMLLSALGEAVLGAICIAGEWAYRLGKQAEGAVDD